MTIAALDLGRRRIGVAVSDPTGSSAFPLGAIERKSLAQDLKQIAAMLHGRPLTAIVVGLPLNMDGSEGPSARWARGFAAKLELALGVKVEMFDERLSSFEAEERLKGMPIKRGARKPAIDAIAATVILEGWLATQTGNPSP
ncbi:MAG: Holliday junction resolvase YqgF [Candidatus Binatus sp.]|nr:Holliday junction resolvase YqgF [Candidatus Binatus sp.]